MRQAACAVTILVLGLALGPAGAAAAPALVAIDSAAPTLAEQDGGGWTVALGLTNLTDDKVAVAVADDAMPVGCALELDRATLPKAEHRAVTLSVPATCDVPDDRLDFALTAEASGDASASTQRLDVSAAPEPDSSTTDWEQLLAFPIAIVGIGIAMVLIYGIWGPREGEGGARSPSLPGLGGSWRFTDSWASNVTVFGGLLTAFFSTSGVSRVLFGDDAEQAIALATVGAAIGVGIAGAGAMVLVSSKRDDDAPSVFGLLAAAAITLAAAAGQLWIGYQTARKLELDDAGTWFLLVLVPGLLLLAVYALRSLRRLLREGAKPPPPPKSETEALIATLAPAPTTRMRAPLL
jgi:uncharacterized membrane protein